MSMVTVGDLALDVSKVLAVAAKQSNSEDRSSIVFSLSNGHEVVVDVSMRSARELIDYFKSQNANFTPPISVLTDSTFYHVRGPNGSCYVEFDPAEIEKNPQLLTDAEFRQSYVNQLALECPELFRVRKKNQSSSVAQEHLELPLQSVGSDGPAFQESHTHTNSRNVVADQALQPSCNTQGAF